MYACIAVVVALFLGPVVSWGQPLADKVPADAIVYLGWRGSESMGADYEKSRLKAVLDESNIPAVFNEMLPQIITRVGMEEREAAEVMKIVAALGGPMWRHPSALYVGPMDWNNGQEPRPHLALLCEAGKEAGALLDQVSAVLRMGGQPPFPVSVFQQGELVVVQVGFEKETDAVAGANAPALAMSDTFKQAMAKVQKEPVIIAYADLDAVMAQIDQAVILHGDEKGKEGWPKVKSALGLGGLKRFIWTSGFDGAEWGSRGFISAPAPRKGLLALLDSQPLSDDILRTIPQSSTFAGAGGMDLSGLVATVRELAGQFDPNAPAQVDQGLGMAKVMLGFDVQTDLLEGLGAEWALYSNPRASGRGMMGLTIVNKLRKPAEVQQALEKLESFGNTMIAGQMQKEKIKIEFKQQKVGGLNVHYLAVPLAAPSWAVQDGNLYIGFYPQMVVAAAEVVATKQKSILDNEGFTMLRKRLGGEKAAAFSYSDLPATAENGYQTMLLLAQLGTGAAEMFGIQAPMMVIPPLTKLRPHLMPVGGFSWSDAEGWHLRGLTPFPGAEVLSVEMSMMGPNFIGAMGGLGMRWGHMVQQPPNRVKAAANLRQIGLGMFVYANDHKGAFPPDLGVLYIEDDFTAEIFISPRSNTSIPAEIKAAKPADRAAWVKANSDYVYLGAGKTDKVGAEEVLAYEKPSIGDGEGGNVLYGDGHVDWMGPWELQQMVEKLQGAKPALPKDGGL